jgi:hypothetical protein
VWLTITVISYLDHVEAGIVAEPAQAGDEWPLLQHF